MNKSLKFERNLRYRTCRKYGSNILKLRWHQPSKSLIYIVVVWWPAALTLCHQYCPKTYATNWSKFAILQEETSGTFAIAATITQYALTSYITHPGSLTDTFESGTKYFQCFIITTALMYSVLGWIMRTATCELASARYRWFLSPPSKTYM